jgi:hypothetical protein
LVIQTKEKVIAGACYAVTQLPARRALKLKAKLIKLFGPSITQLFLTSQEPEEQAPTKESPEENYSCARVDDVKIREIRKGSVVRGVQLLAESIEEKILDELLAELIQGVRKDGVELTMPIIDNTFSGQLTSLYELIWFILEVNYADFFGLASTGNLLQEATQSLSDGKKTYTYR